MMGRLIFKLRVLSRALASDGCVIITHNDGGKFHYSFFGNDPAAPKLFERLKAFVPHWYAQVKDNI